MVHRVRWPIRQRQAIDRQLATTVQEPLHHREGPYTLVSRLDRDGDSSGPGSRPQSQDRRYRENAKKGPLVEPHLGPVQPIIAVHRPTAPQLPANPIAATASHSPIPQPTVPAVTASPPQAIQARRREQRLRAAAPQAPPAPRGLSLPWLRSVSGTRSERPAVPNTASADAVRPLALPTLNGTGPDRPSSCSSSSGKSKLSTTGWKCAAQNSSCSGSHSPRADHLTRFSVALSMLRTPMGESPDASCAVVAPRMGSSEGLFVRLR